MAPSAVVRSCGSVVSNIWRHTPGMTAGATLLWPSLSWTVLTPDRPPRVFRDSIARHHANGIILLCSARAGITRATSYGRMQLDIENRASTLIQRPIAALNR